MRDDKKESLVQPGEEIGPYQVVRAFRGHGGMAQVCEVKVRDKYYEPGMPKRLAMKIADDVHQHALVAEAEYLSRFEHPNVVRVFPLPGFESRAIYAAKERFSVGWRWYYVMELLDGGSLHHSLTSPTTTLAGVGRNATTGEQPLAVVTALGIGRQLARALEHIHARNVINLDVKPNNILFRRRKAQFLKSSVPAAVLSDFGIARDLRHPRFGVLGVATPEYMSPEHAREVMAQPNTPLQTGAPVHTPPPDPRSDLFSLGVLLYEILTGEMPFSNIATLLHKDYAPKPPREIRAAVPVELEAAVMHALAKDPAARYQSASEMAADLDKVKQQLDWGMVGRRIFTGVTVTAIVAGGILGAPHVTDYLERLKRPTPAPTTLVNTPRAILPTPTYTSTPSPTPTLTATAKRPAAATSTPKPTSTPTPTRPPATPTPSATPQP